MAKQEKDFLNQSFKHSKCKRCGITYRYMSIDKTLKICALCQNMEDHPNQQENKDAKDK